MKVVIVGNNDGPLILLKALYNGGVDVAAVGLQKEIDSDLARQYQDLIDDDKLLVGFHQNSLLDWLQKFSPTCIINCFCNFKFTKILNLYTVLNIHLAPLPLYRGRHPLHWALINGEEKFGITIHKMEAEIDAGEIYWQRMVSIDKGMTVQALRDKLMKELQKDFCFFLEKYFAGQIIPTENEEHRATYVARRYPRDSKLTEWHDRDIIYRKIMALSSTTNPAYIEIGGQIVYIKNATEGSRRYVGFGAPFVYQTQKGQAGIVCLDGRTLIVSSLLPDKYMFKLNDRF